MSNSIIIPLNDLKATLQMIQSSLDRRYDSSEPSNMLELLEELSYLLGNSSLAEASARFWLEQKKQVVIAEYVANTPQKERLQPLMLKDYILSMCAAEVAAYELASSQHSSLVHRIDAVRSALSYLKAEIQNINQSR
jgi:hypothetical protein